LRMLGAGLEWGPYPLIAALGMLGETIFSMVQRNDSGSSARI
jgi:hypothetical protein